MSKKGDDFQSINLYFFLFFIKIHLFCQLYRSQFWRTHRTFFEWFCLWNVLSFSCRTETKNRCFLWIYVMFCAIWYHLYNLKNVKKTHGGVLLLVKLQVKAKLLNVTHVLNCTNGTKSRNASHYKNKRF